MENRYAETEHSRGGELGEHLPVVSLGLGMQGRFSPCSEAAAHRDFELPPLTQSLIDLKGELAMANVLALGIRDAGRLVASLRLHRFGSVIELRRLVVAPDRQGQGLGSRLLVHAETVFPGCRELRLYTRLGYRESGRTPAGGYHLVHFTKTPGDR